MKSFIKLTWLTLFLTIFLFSIGCQEKDTPQQFTTYSKELSSYFPITLNTKLNYFGSVEYAHTLVLNKITDNKNSLTLNFKGQIADMSDGEGPSPQELAFENQYIIGEDYIREIQLNEIRKHSQSIIRDQIILKLPLSVDNTWSQKVNIDGKEYTEETKIIEISNNTIKTEATVKGIPDFPHGEYKEFRTFKKGFGIIGYQTTIMLDNPDTTELIPFEFQYWLYDHE